MKTIIIAAFALTALFNTRAFADTDYTIDLENFCPTALDIQFYSARLGWRIIQLLPGSETQIEKAQDTNQLWFLPTHNGQRLFAYGDQVQPRQPDGDTSTRTLGT